MMFKLLLEFGGQAKDYIEDAHAYLKTNPTASPGAVTARILAKSKDWNPVFKGQKVITPGVRAKLAAALADLTYNIRAAEAGKELV